MITLSTSVQPSADVLFTEVDQEMVLLNLKTGHYFNLNPVGARLWRLLTEGHSLGQICQVLFEEYEVDSAQLERDVLALVEQLAKNGLLQVSPP